MSAPANALRVLLADDEELARETIADLLRSLGHEVVAVAGSGREAIALAPEATMDVALLDVHMPDGSGLDAARAFAASMPGVAIVLYSGDAELRLSEADAAETSAIAFLTKPVSPASLDGTLRLAVARARAMDDARRQAEEARQQVEARKTIERAKGILMRRTGSSEQEAYAILRRASQDRAVPMLEIARAVLESEPGRT